MTSLNLHCTAAATSSAHPHPPSHRLSAKPSHFLSHAKRSNRLQISCQNKKEADNPQGRVDRRNMLVGLYGAANLIVAEPASANPIQAPQLDKCGVATNLNTGKQLDMNCCPPMSDNIIDYKLPPVFHIKSRPSAHRVSPEYIRKYNMAMDRMKRLPKDDPRSFMQQANIHCAYCNGAYDQPGQGSLDLQVHNSWLFFPFHRWYLYFHERILGKLIGDPTFALPFWNWDNPKGMTIPPMFTDTNAAIYNEKRNPACAPPAVLDLGMTRNPDPLQVVANNLTIMYSEMVRGNSDVYDFMGKPYREGTPVNPGPGASERGSHTAVHVWVGDPRQPSGEDLGNFYSAGRDPLFYCHHANVDRMWTLWQSFLPSNKIADKKILDADFLNTSFLFYDEDAHLVRVTVKDCMDNLKMGYKFERIDLPWLDYRPPPQTARARVNKMSAGTASAETVFPLTLDRVVRVEVPKAKRGKADEVLLIENITVDTTKFLKFDVFVNDEDDNLGELDKAAYAGTYAQVPHKTGGGSATTSIRLKLTEVYEDMDVADDDTVVVTLVPRHKGEGVTIGGIKIIENPTPSPPRRS
ncbi:polyphenol oxidase I, chloroplastic-like [Salvia miltiorrhiza]|uniref:polyphenol oxidase I, chloroplastic-like n=1 Tax=Salvia miltiorrhiza TaxID=226208 RepID=UPI0025AD8D19|nr:polyphenol oxidase I, chloroplastic-like [Salvia miltiorrhiza]